jgi:hypothetical protein
MSANVSRAVAQEAQSQSGQKTSFLAKLLPQNETSKPTGSSATASRSNQPKELRVIDRDTARRNSETGWQPGGLQVDQPANMNPSRNLGDWPQTSRDAGTLPAARERNSHPIQQATYQTGQSKFYQTPPPNPTPYDIAPVYGSPYSNPMNAPVHAPLYSPPYSPPVRAVETWSLSPEQVLVDPRMELLDDRRGLPSEEHPSFNTRYFDSQNQPSATGGNHRNWDNRSSNRRQPNGEPFSTSPTSELDHRGHGHGIYESAQPNAAYYGQGYLQQGTNLHGMRLQTRSLSATERALELQADNQYKEEVIQRLQADLEVRVREYEASQATIKRKEDELNMAMVRIEELRQQIMQLTEERNSAVQQRINLERQFNEQLKGIESMLDGVLLEQLSDNNVIPKAGKN